MLTPRIYQNTLLLLLVAIKFPQASSLKKKKKKNQNPTSLQEIVLYLPPLHPDLLFTPSARQSDLCVHRPLKLLLSESPAISGLLNTSDSSALFLTHSRHSLQHSQPLLAPGNTPHS